MEETDKDDNNESKTSAPLCKSRCHGVKSVVDVSTALLCGHKGVLSVFYYVGMLLLTCYVWAAMFLDTTTVCLSVRPFFILCKTKEDILKSVAPVFVYIMQVSGVQNKNRFF